jgi:hypothetical protein
MGISIKTLVQDIVSTKLWSLSDRLHNVSGEWRHKELQVLDRLPTPSNAIGLVSGALSSLAFKIGPTCEVCDCWPCMCHELYSGNSDPSPSEEL